MLQSRMLVLLLRLIKFKINFKFIMEELPVEQSFDVIDLMKRNQLEVTPSGNYGKLSMGNYSLLSKHITDDFLHSDKCVIYTGQCIKGLPIYSYKAKKVSLNRLLYLNFVGNLTEDQIIKTKKDCDYRCCNLNHIEILNKTRGNIPLRPKAVEPTTKTNGKFVMGIEY